MKRIGCGMRNPTYVYEVNGIALKCLPPQYKGLSDTMEGERRLRAAGVPHAPILDHWNDENGVYFAQVLCERIPSSDVPGMWDELAALAWAALEVGVVDVTVDNIGLLDGVPVILDMEYLVEEDSKEEWKFLVARSWDEERRAMWESRLQGS